MFSCVKGVMCQIVATRWTFSKYLSLKSMHHIAGYRSVVGTTGICLFYQKYVHISRQLCVYLRVFFCTFAGTQMSRPLIHKSMFIHVLCAAAEVANRILGIITVFHLSSSTSFPLYLSLFFYFVFPFLSRFLYPFQSMCVLVIASWTIGFLNFVIKKHHTHPHTCIYKLHGVDILFTVNPVQYIVN